MPNERQGDLAHPYVNFFSAHIPWFKQLAKFGGVGVLATLTHVAVYVLLVESLTLSPMAANAVAFGVAVTVSFSGHAGWTFRHQYQESQRAVLVLFGRFAVSSVFGFLLNSLFVFLIVNWWQLPYVWTIPFFLFVTPVALFLINKYWVFS